MHISGNDLTLNVLRVWLNKVRDVKVLRNYLLCFQWDFCLVGTEWRLYAACVLTSCHFVQIFFAHAGKFMYVTCILSGSIVWVKVLSSGPKVRGFKP